MPNMSSTWNSLPSLWLIWEIRLHQRTSKKGWELGEKLLANCCGIVMDSTLCFELSIPFFEITSFQCSLLIWSPELNVTVLLSGFGGLTWSFSYITFRVDRNKYQIHIPLPPKIDPTVTMMQVWQVLQLMLLCKLKVWRIILKCYRYWCCLYNNFMSLFSYINRW